MQSPIALARLSLPKDLRCQALLRLRALLVLFGAMHLVIMTLDLLGPHSWGWHKQCAEAGSVISAVALAVTVAAYGVVRRARLPTERLLDLALAYQVAICFGIAFQEQSQPLGGISLIAVVIIVFPLFVPTSWQRTLLASLGAAASAPLAHVLYSHQAGIEPFGDANLLLRLGVNFLFAFMAVVPAKIVARMARAVGEARRMGSYELTRKLGQGGMGEVWRARHHMLRRPAAIKLIRPEAFGSGSDEALVTRFEREAQATAALESPHTVEIYDFGVAEDGSFYYVMELLRGLNLEALVERFGPLPPERAAYVLRQVCESLDEAHDQGLIHRDIKPANIVLSHKGRHYDFVKVLDFGLVKTMRGDDTPKLTRDNALHGTPAYLAPETVVGDSAIDGRSDIYALGCVAYWLLTGGLVFEEQTAMKMAIAHATQQPDAPSKRAPFAVPAWLDELVLSCLAKDPADRPQSAFELMTAIERNSLGFAQPWSRAQAEAWWTDHDDDAPAPSEASGPVTAVVQPATALSAV
jgi:serine/threonine-protein kinase